MALSLVEWRESEHRYLWQLQHAAQLCVKVLWAGVQLPFPPPQKLEVLKSLLFSSHCRLASTGEAQQLLCLPLP